MRLRLVLHAVEEESVGRSGLAGGAAVAGGEDISGPGDVTGALPDFDERADDRTDHLVQEAVAGDFDGDAFIDALDMDREKRADGVGAQRAGRFEAGKVVLAEESLGGGVHFIGIERLGIMPDVASIEHIRRAAIVNLVAVGFPPRVVGGVEVFGGFFDGDDDDVLREYGVETAVEVGGGKHRFRSESDDLAERVDTGVGAAGSGDAELFACDLVPGGFDGGLNGGLGRLNLPAGIGCAVIGHGQLERAGGHGDSFKSTQG